MADAPARCPSCKMLPADGRWANYGYCYDSCHNIPASVEPKVIRPTCVSCRWWDEPKAHDRSLIAADVDARGYAPAVRMCRARAPFITEPHGEWENTSAWPTTTAGMWCGEHAPIDSAKGVDNAR